MRIRIIPNTDTFHVVNACDIHNTHNTTNLSLDKVKADLCQTRMVEMFLVNNILQQYTLSGNQGKVTAS